MISVHFGANFIFKHVLLVGELGIEFEILLDAGLVISGDAGFSSGKISVDFLGRLDDFLNLFDHYEIN